MNEIEERAEHRIAMARARYQKARRAYEEAYADPGPHHSSDGAREGWEVLCRVRRVAAEEAWSEYLDARAYRARLDAIREDAART